MITRLSKEEYKIYRRHLLTNIVYAISHDELDKMRPEHTELKPVEIYLNARAFADTILKLSDIDEGLQDEIIDLQEDCQSETEAMIILVVSAIILQAKNKNNPSDQIRNIILHIFTHTLDNPLCQPLLDKFADKEAERIAQGKIINWIDYELQDIQINHEVKDAIPHIIHGLMLNLDKMDSDTIKSTILLLSKFNLDNNHAIDKELNELFDKLGYKTQNITNIKELVLQKHVQTQIGTVGSGGTGNINNPK